MNFFKKIFKKRETIVADSCVEIKEIFQTLSSLLKHCVLDLSIISQLIVAIKKQSEEAISNENQKFLFMFIRKNLRCILFDIIERFNKNDMSLQTYYYLTTTLNFYLILLINYQVKLFYEIMFDLQDKFMGALVICLKFSFAFSEQHDIIKILLNFYTAGFVIAFEEFDMIETYTVFKEKMIKLMVNNIDFKKFCPRDYTTLMKHVFMLEFDLKNDFDKSDICKNEDKPLCKQII